MIGLFAAGDAGGARALLPVMEHCAATGVDFFLLDHGTLGREAVAEWKRIQMPRPGVDMVAGMRTLLKDGAYNWLAFGSSVQDSAALAMARQAGDLGVTTLHLLDNWSSYRRRLAVDGLPPFRPDIYAVMDDVAFQAAQQEGVDGKSLRITGQPALATVAEWVRQRPARARRQPLQLAFLSEPAAADQGQDASSPHFRGYTEETSLRAFCHGLVPFADEVEVHIVPHPREESAQVASRWDQYRQGLRGTVCAPDAGRKALLEADAVAGMASVLLYQAWLMGLPVLSIQPGLVLPSLRMLQSRPGVEFVDIEADAPARIGRWLLATRQQDHLPRWGEIRRHCRAAEQVLHCLGVCRMERN